MAIIRPTASVIWDAIFRLHFDYAIPLASAIAFSGVLALFPFLIFVTSLAGFIGGEPAADQAVSQMFEILPQEVAKGLAPEIRRVLGEPRGDILTASVFLTVLISTSGVESLRTALNRAYRLEEDRSFWYRRLQSVLFVIAGAAAVLVLGFSIILAPVIFVYAADKFEWLLDYWSIFDSLRFAVGIMVLFGTLLGMHFWLPAGWRKLQDILPGVLITMLLWLIAGVAYSEYLARYNHYVKTYAGLANLMIALMFFFVTALIFVFGGELNRAIIERDARVRGGLPPPAADGESDDTVDTAEDGLETRPALTREPEDPDS